SYMVRLEGLPGLWRRASVRDFNSYMVRLEESWRSTKQPASIISIPIWCDWKKETVKNQDQDFSFQFLYGAIGSCCVCWFGSYCLLFQFLYGAIGRKKHFFGFFSQNISIPIW